jgi:hypothetical protein
MAFCLHLLQSADELPDHVFQVAMTKMAEAFVRVH